MVVLACHQQLKTPPRSPQLSPRKHTERRGEKIRRMFLFLALRGQGGQRLKHKPLSSVCFSHARKRTHKTCTSNRRVCKCKVLRVQRMAVGEEGFRVLDWKKVRRGKENEVGAKKES